MRVLVIEDEAYAMLDIYDLIILDIMMPKKMDIR